MAIEEYVDSVLSMTDLVIYGSFLEEPSFPEILVRAMSLGKPIIAPGYHLDDAIEFCLEMLEAGHSPNVATFVGLVDGLCKEKGVEEARNVIGTLKQKGFQVNDKAVRQFLDKKAPFTPLVWEAIFGKKTSRETF